MAIQNSKLTPVAQVYTVSGIKFDSTQKSYTYYISSGTASLSISGIPEAHLVSSSQSTVDGMPGAQGKPEFFEDYNQTTKSGLTAPQQSYKDREAATDREATAAANAASEKARADAAQAKHKREGGRTG
ncbi:hypothetical protein MMC18_002479 [Xylographa bjoerkii]|nr:hypothetical protein [Xylographa bjoerkii]